MPAKNSHERPWIKPELGLGDTLMLSGVLKAVVDRTPTTRFNMVRGPLTVDLFAEHPAIERIGHLPPNARVIPTNYWEQAPPGPGARRAYQTLARLFGVPTPVEETLYLAGDEVDVSWWHRFLPWRTRNAVIAPGSGSPRKTLSAARWQEVVDALRSEGFFVVQVGEAGDAYIRHAYSLLGVTTLRQLVSLLRCFQVVITVHNLLMHAAHLVGVPAVVLWGPTQHEAFGYGSQRHLQASPCQCHAALGVDPRASESYFAPCPLGTDHCMHHLDPREVCQAVVEMAKRHSDPRGTPSGFGTGRLKSGSVRRTGGFP